jgi:SUMO ligase MMS21 Smc5/6 complex component
MVLLKNPVCNKVCKHHYSKDAILDYIATKTRNRGQVSCPVAGCSNRAVTAAQLEDDAEISLHVRRFQRQEQQQSTQRTSQAEDLMDSEEE